MRKAILTLTLILFMSLFLASPISAAQEWFITAYCLRGITASGTYVHPGTIAVDPNVVPLGTRLWVSRYGYGRALDTGALVKGYHVDVWVGNCSRAHLFTHYGPVKIL